MARLLIQLADQAAASQSLPAAALATLQAAGVTDVRPSHPELPGLYLASVPDTVNADDLVAKLQGVPGIRHVDVERFRSAF